MTKKPTVYAVQALLCGESTANEILMVRFRLAKEIAQYAKQSGDNIHFYQYVDPASVRYSNPHILLECSEDFLSRIQDKFGVYVHPSDSAPGTAAIIRSTDAPQIEAPQSMRKKPGGFRP
jgi:hypothetical protein